MWNYPVFSVVTVIVKADVMFTRCHRGTTWHAVLTVYTLCVSVLCSLTNIVNRRLLGDRCRPVVQHLQPADLLHVMMDGMLTGHAVTCVIIIGVDLSGLLGGRMASAEGGSVSSGVAYGEGCPLSSRLRGLGELRELPHRGPGQSPGRKRDFGVFWRPQNALFCTYMTKSGGGTICISVPPAPNSGGDLSPLSPPVIYAHGYYIQ